MPKSYRIRTQPGVDKSIQVQVEQDFDFLEILSLKLRQEDVYTRFCADYGVVVGRVFANGGTGIPNARISIFIPLDAVDAEDPIISTLFIRILLLIRKTKMVTDTICYPIVHHIVDTQPQVLSLTLKTY